MDIEKIVTEAIAKLTGNTDLLKEFAANPVATLEKKLGIDLPDDQLNAVIEGIKAKLPADLDLGNLAKTAEDVVTKAAGKGILDKIKGIFGK